MVSRDVEAAGEVVPLVGNKVRSAYDRFFLRDKNEAFARNYELAFRAACFMALLAAPFVIAEGDVFGIGGAYGSAAVMFFLFVFCPTVGQTTQCIMCALFGLGLAFLSIFIMFGVFPTGVTAAQEPHIIGYALAHGAIFSWLMLWLNLEDCTRIFALANFVYYWMAFLTPSSEAHSFGTGFTVDFKGKAFVSIVTGCFGCLFAFIGINFPYPMLAIERARNDSKKMAETINDAWKNFGTYYCGTAEAEYTQDRLERDMRHCEAILTEIDADLANSYWESFGLGMRARSRELLLRCRKTTGEVYDQLVAIQRCLRVASLDPLHSDFMGTMKPFILSAIQEASFLLTTCIEVGSAGEIKEDQVEAFRAAANRTRVAMTNVTEKFKATRKSPQVDLDIMEERAFCVTVCGFCRMVNSLADHFLADYDGKESLKPSRGLKNVASFFTGVFDTNTIMSRKSLGFAMRNWLALMIAFLVGYHNPGNKLLKSYDAAIACTVAVQISRFMASAIKGNMDRLQGLVIGVVFGQMAYNTFGWCHWYSQMALLFTLWCWVLFTMFMFLDGHMGAVGILLAIFGTGPMLAGCKDGESDELGRRSAYMGVIDCCVAVTICVIVDMFMSTTTAGQMAYDQYIALWQRLLRHIKEVPESENKKTRVHKGEVVAMIDDARSLLKEASEEPRWWRTPFQSALYYDACTNAFHIRVCLSALENIASHGAEAGQEKTEAFIQMCHLPEFAQVWQNMSNRMEVMANDLLPIFIHDTEDELPWEKNDFIATPRMKSKFEDDLKLFLQSFNKTIKGFDGDSLEEDTGSQAAMVAIYMRGIFLEVSELRKMILQK